MAPLGAPWTISPAGGSSASIVNTTDHGLINGASTSCTRVAAGIQPPFNSVSVVDASNTGWGGNVLFDNMDVTKP